MTRLSDRPADRSTLSITFSAKSSAEVRSLVQSRAYIQEGDSFDLVSGSPASLPLATGLIDQWASMLRSAYPTADIFAHTAGVAHFEELARHAGPSLSGIYYDYEPGYESEFTWDFSESLARFKEVTAIAHRHGTESVGYPTGRPLLSASLERYHWNYATLAGAVDRLVVQTQRYCLRGPSEFEEATAILLGQFASDRPGAPLPTLQITIGDRTPRTPNAVGPGQGSDCARVLAAHGIRELYIWSVPRDHGKVVRFLQEIGRG